ncbi:unnamed protein product [Allacma fusca]|uniref:CRAL-TRIO domain-containing protein n=1 Tax=Allacma fusca TaxID=39272 RepID=A0A8J2LNX6_9HEXA|nr:unnamed protein product [Allacma fusca]
MQLIRWIRARENDLDLAESMFRKSFKWREENDLEDILTWEPPEILKRLSPYDLNTDKDGFPVVIVSAGRVDLKRILQAGYMKEFIRYNIQTWERAMEKMKGRLTPDGVPMTQYVCVLDMEGLSMKYVASIKVIELIKTAIQNFESNYPEILGKCYVINVSRAFQILFGIAKPLMSGRTIQKIEIMTTEEKWKPVLLGVIDANQLPECYGGTASSNLHSLIGYSMKEKSDTFVENLVQNLTNAVF